MQSFNFIPLQFTRMGGLLFEKTVQYLDISSAGMCFLQIMIIFGVEGCHSFVNEMIHTQDTQMSTRTLRYLNTAINTCKLFSNLKMAASHHVREMFDHVMLPVEKRFHQFKKSSQYWLHMMHVNTSITGKTLLRS